MVGLVKGGVKVLPVGLSYLSEELLTGVPVCIMVERFTECSANALLFDVSGEELLGNLQVLCGIVAFSIPYDGFNAILTSHSIMTLSHEFVTRITQDVYIEN